MPRCRWFFLIPVKLSRWINGGGSFLASHDRRVVFGLGARPQVADLEIRWPSGVTQTVRGLQPGRYHRIRERLPVRR